LVVLLTQEALLTREGGNNESKEFNEDERIRNAAKVGDV